MDALRIIAQREGDPLLVDTPEEYHAALTLLADSEIEAFDELKALEPEMRLQVNWVFRDCAREDCFPLFIPLPENVAYGVFVFYAAATRFLSFSQEKWSHIIEPLENNVPQTPEEERGRLSTVAARFEAEVAPHDFPGLAGNLYAMIFPEGQQDCNNKAATDAQLVLALQSMGLLRFHRIDFDEKYIGNPLRHVAVRLVENATEEIYALDTWNSQKDPEVAPEWWWRDRNAYLFERPRP